MQSPVVVVETHFGNQALDGTQEKKRERENKFPHGANLARLTAFT